MITLIILDGWGYREDPSANAIANAKKPCWDALWEHYPHTLISGCGRCVGLPDDQMGNSEVGHLNIGAGRVVYQDLTRIDLSIREGDFFSNSVFLEAIQRAVSTKKAIHILGLVSPGGVHSQEQHIYALLDLIKQQQASEVYVHAFLDGRDTPPKSAKASLVTLMQHGKIASITGRYYAMDRDKRWERIEKTYDLLTSGIADYANSDPLAALEEAYARGETDEFVKPTIILPVTIQEGDIVFFMNFRADRARELTRAFIDPQFNGFPRKRWPHTQFITLTEYDATFQVPVVFKPQRLEKILGEYLSQLGLRQLRIAETEKYAHVTFFFNGGIEKPYPLEDRILIPSPKVATYDLQPEMSALEVTEQLIANIQSQQYDVIICNFANPDMVGHTGNLPATIQAIQVIDQCLAKIIPALLAVGGEALITADHGNAEMMFDQQTQQPHTAHTHQLVPLLYIGRKAVIAKQNGVLSDIAPTLLYLMGIPKPAEMTGESVFKLI